jgi:hypothetical protein
MIKRNQNTKTINDQKETEHKDYQLSKGNRTQRLSMIKRKQSKQTINDQKQTEKNVGVTEECILPVRLATPVVLLLLQAK